MFLFARVVLLVKILAKLDHIQGSKYPEPPKRASIRKTLKTFNLTTTNALLMKLITIIYPPHETVSQKPLRAKNLVSWLNFQELQITLKLSRMSCITLHCITGKNFVQIEPHLGQHSIKNHIKQVQNYCYANF